MACAPVSFADANFSAYCPDDDSPNAAASVPPATEAVADAAAVSESTAHEGPKPIARTPESLAAAIDIALGLVSASTMTWVGTGVCAGAGLLYFPCIVTFAGAGAYMGKLDKQHVLAEPFNHDEAFSAAKWAAGGSLLGGLLAPLVRHGFFVRVEIPVPDSITPKLPAFTKLVFSGVPFERAARAVAQTPEEYDILAEVFVRVRDELTRSLSIASREGQFAGAVLGNASKTTLDHATGHPSTSATGSVGADSH